MIIPRPIADWLVTSTRAKPAVAEPPEGLGGPGQQADQGGVGQVVDVLDQRAVAVEEDRRSVPALVRPFIGPSSGGDSHPADHRRFFSSVVASTPSGARPSSRSRMAR